MTESGAHAFALIRRRQFGEELDISVALQTGAGRNQAAHDHVLLQAAQIIDLPGDGRFGENAGGLLEARRGDERVSGKRRLGDAKEQRTAGSGTSTIVNDAIVFLAEAELIDLLFEEERRIAHVFDFHPAHHLTNDRLDVLVVNIHALQPVDFLNRIDQVSLRVLFAEDGEDIVRVERPVNEGLAGSHVFAFLHVDVDAARNGVFLRRLAIFAFDVDLALALGDFAVLHDTVDFADDRGILGLASLEEFDNARQTAGDVFRLRGFARDLREHVAGLDFITIDDHQVSARRHQVLLRAAACATDVDGGLMLFITGRQRNDELRKTSDFVHLLFDRDTGLQVLELHGTCRFGEDREGVGIPLDHRLTERDRLTIFDLEARAVYDVVPFFFAALFVDNGDQAGAVHRDDLLTAALDHLQVDKLHEAIVASLDFRLFGDASGGAADVERAHRELRARLADGLRGDDADRFAHLNEAPGGEVAAVAASANTAPGFASEHGANLHAFDAGRLHGIGQLFGDFLVDLDDHVAFVVFDLLERDAADNAVAQRLDFDAGFENRFNVNSVGRAAVEFVDDHVLSNVDEAAREVAGIGGFERRVGQTFTSAVRRDEVFQHGEAFAEVRSDGLLDDFARGLGHQTAHTGKLPDLLLRTSSARVRHDVDRIDHALLVLLL